MLLAPWAAALLTAPALLSASCTESDAWFIMGQGELDWEPIEDGDELLMVLGGQGLLMFPMPLQGSGFKIPDDPTDYTHPDAPILDIYLDIEGHAYDDGHFEKVLNYPIPLTPVGDGSYQFIYVTLFIPDELVNPCDIHGLEGKLRAELDVVDDDLLLWERTVVIAVPEELCL